MRVMVVEDDEHIGAHVSRALAEARMMVTLLTNGASAVSQMERERRQGYRYDAIVLDLTLPGMDGIDVLKRMRASEDNTPVLVLTARSSLTDRVLGLEQGADDYLPKPFEPLELVARLRVLGRRAEKTTECVRCVGNLCFDPGKSLFSIDGKSINLTRKASAVLEYLFKRAGTTVRNELLLELDQEGMSNEALAIQISRVRKVLQENGCNVGIKAAHGVGYTLEVSATQ